MVFSSFVFKTASFLLSTLAVCERTWHPGCSKHLREPTLDLLWMSAFSHPSVSSSRTHFMMLRSGLYGSHTIMSSTSGSSSRWPSFLMTLSVFLGFVCRNLRASCTPSLMVQHDGYLPVCLMLELLCLVSKTEL